MGIYILLWIGLALLVGVLGKNREIGFGGAFFFSILLSPLFGLIITLLSKTKKALDEEHKFLAFKELGKKAEYKGHIEEAIDHYMDALYHLENDYNHLPKKLEDGRLNHIETIKEKVENLKKINSDNSQQADIKV